MGAVKGVVAKTAHGLATRLEWIDKSEWPDLIHRKASFAHTALNNDLETAISIIDEFEEHEAWKYLDQDRDNFYRFQVQVDPANIELIRKGYKLLIGRGEKCKNILHAIDAALQMQRADQEDLQNQRPVGRPSKEETLYNNSKDVQDYPAPAGNSVKAALRRLRNDRPDIHARVLNGELSANAGMIEAGFRKKRPSKKRSVLEHLHSWWEKASEAEREIFLKEIQ